MFVQSSLFNVNSTQNHWSIYIKWQQVKTEWGVSRVKRVREREQPINRVRCGALDRNRNGMGWKWLLVKMDT